MRWLKAIFGSDESSPRDSVVRSTREIQRARGRMEPFTYVSSGLEAWEAGDHERAERLLREGVDAYRGAEPEGVDFALGRLGAYLLDQERVDDAAQVLDEAITRGTDIPAIWRDYLDIMALPAGLGWPLRHRHAMEHQPPRAGTAVGRAPRSCTTGRPCERFGVRDSGCRSGSRERRTSRRSASSLVSHRGARPHPRARRSAPEGARSLDGGVRGREWRPHDCEPAVDASRACA